MKLQERYNYKAAEFSVLEQPIRVVMGMYGNAEKWFADIKDRVLIDMGMPFLSNYIHRLEHVQPERVDDFAHVAHTYHLRLPYPSTPELGEEFGNDLDRVFEVCVDIVEEIDSALSEFIRVTDGRLHALSLLAEELQMRNIEEREKLLAAWAMWDNGQMSRASFDSWCRNYLNGGTYDEQN